MRARQGIGLVVVSISAPMFIYARLATDAAHLLRQRPALDAWLDRLIERPSIAATRSPFEPEAPRS